VEAVGHPVTFLLAAANVLLLLIILLVWLTRVSARYVQSQFELEQKKIELVQLEQLALAGRLSAGLLHDLKKPVIHIREEASEEPTPETLKDIREQSELFLSMLRDSGLEGFARLRSSEEECCDVIDLVDRSLRLVAYERNDVQVIRDFDAD
jgi:C4-dicarboxylate-specific signal transduction histidine kinase